MNAMIESLERELKSAASEWWHHNNQAWNAVANNDNEELQIAETAKKSCRDRVDRAWVSLLNNNIRVEWPIA